jgi:hypothetical protein
LGGGTVILDQGAPRAGAEQEVAIRADDQAGDGPSVMPAPHMGTPTGLSSGSHRVEGAFRQHWPYCRWPFPHDCPTDHPSFHKRTIPVSTTGVEARTPKGLVASRALTCVPSGPWYFPSKRSA